MLGKRDNRKEVVRSIAAMTLYCAFTALAFSWLHANGLVVSKGSADLKTLPARFFQDALLCWAFPLMAVAWLRFKGTSFESLGFAKGSIKAVLLLLAAYILLYLACGPKTLVGTYFWLCYLLGVAFSEELVFRGIGFAGIYDALGRTRSAAVIGCVVSGAVWGAAHAIVPAIVGDASFVELALSQVGGGVLASALFSYVFVKSRTLLAPMLLHATFDCLSLL